MDVLEQFRRERKPLGHGATSEIWLWRGFAYKCYIPDWPESLIRFEEGVQEVICKKGLPVVRYHPSELPHSLKMDYIPGETLLDQLRRRPTLDCLPELYRYFDLIHAEDGEGLPPLNPFVREQIACLPIAGAEKEKANKILDILPDENRLLHVDYHFGNLMIADGRYYIIDWISAKRGSVIYDCARTYVILEEFYGEAAPAFRALTLEREGFSEEDFDRAVFVMRLQRAAEKSSAGRALAARSAMLAI